MRSFLHLIYRCLLVVFLVNGLWVFSAFSIPKGDIESKNGINPNPPINAQLNNSGPIVIIEINGSINPASDDFLGTSLKEARNKNARLFVLKLNTPGGLLSSMQEMVKSLLDSEIPTVVYVTPSGGSATSAGVFITLAANFAVMAPGTTIGAAHPVSGSGQDMDADMREKVENFAVSLMQAIAQERGRNIAWAEQAVRESVSISARDALDEKVIDFIASDLEILLSELEGKTISVKGIPITLRGLGSAPREIIEMSFKQTVVNLLSDPNIAMLLGLGAMLGIGLELYHPGTILPGVFGAICLILSLTASQIIPINYGGLGLLLLGIVFFVIELFLPSFGIWGISGIVCLVLGSIYIVDTDLVFGIEGFHVDRLMIGSLAAFVGSLLLIVSYLVLKTNRSHVTTGKEGLIGKTAVLKVEFDSDQGLGKVQLMGEYWNARLIQSQSNLMIKPGDKVKVLAIESGMTLVVELDKVP